MNSQTFKTLFMGLLAAAASLVAGYYYPWPVPVQKSEAVGNALVESYDTSSVRTMRITQYNDDKNNLDKIILRRMGQKWVIPSKLNFVANRVQQYTISANALNERTVLEERTENQQDHIKYGVVDPVDFEKTDNRSAICK